LLCCLVLCMFFLQGEGEEGFDLELEE
jgi:hypothetical protein